MKTVSGKVVSTKPISLSKAAKSLSKFVVAETGASQAVSAYLRRASASFNELVQFHKDLNHKNKHIIEQNPDEEDTERKSHNKKMKKEKSEGSLGIEERKEKEKKKRKSEAIDDGDGFDSAEKSGKTKKKKKRRIEHDQ